MSHILGIVLLALPFIAIAILGIKLLGWKQTLLIFLTATTIIFIIFVGVALLRDLPPLALLQKALLKLQ